MKILHLEDDDRDAALVHRLLTKDWPDCIITLVSARDPFVRALTEDVYDIVLSDFKLPDFSGLEALKIARMQAPEIPFIFFSGTIGEERAVEAVKAGADDYVLKDRMQRLPVAIQSLLSRHDEQRARRRVEEALAQEQYLLRMLMENLPDRIYFKDLDSRFLAVSRSFARRHQLAPAEFKGKSDFDIFDEEHAQQAHEDERQIIRTGQPMLDVEEKETWADRSVTWVLTTKMPLRDTNGNIVGTFGISHDITARRQAEERNREQAEIIDQTPIAIVLVDLNHRVSYCNASAVQLYDLPSDKLIGRTMEELFAEETLVELRPARLATFATGRWSGEVAVVTKTGRRFQGEFHMSLVHDSSGRPKARLSVAIDITERKKLEAQFLRAQRLEGLGMLAAGIAHDLNNILAPVLMGAPLLRSRNADASDRQVLETIETSAVRGAALVRQILSFAHGTGGEKTLVQVKHLLREISELIRETFSKSITLEEEIPNDLWPVRGNATQLHQVLLNLCVNARDAMPQGGTLHLSAANQALEAAMLQAHPGAIPGPYLVLGVTDTGTGIPAEILNLIWDPFFTTKGESNGTGLGLATVRGIAVSHGGFIEVTSEPGHGSAFTLFLPAAEQSVAQGTIVREHSPSIRGLGELVLVVDDEPPIRTLITTILSRSGYRAIVATNGIEAVALYASRMDEISLVITDINMPGMGGGNLAAALTRLNPTVKILFISGGSTDGGGEALPAVARILAKPFTGEMLCASVNDALEDLGRAARKLS